MPTVFRAGQALSLSLAVLFMLMAPKPAQATTIVTNGDTVALAACLPCSFGGGLESEYLDLTAAGLGKFDHFWATLTGPVGQVNTFVFTPTTFMEVVTSGDGVNPVSPFLGNSAFSVTLQPGVTQSVSLQVGTTGAIVLSLFVPSGSVTDASGLFANPQFAFVLDPISGVATLGDPATACASGSVFTDGVGCTVNNGGSGGGGTTTAPVPLPASVLLLLGGIGGLGLLRRRSAHTA